MNSIYNRTSIRKFKQEPLKQEEIKKILEAGFSAPSAKNAQPWQFIVVQDKTMLENLSQVSPYAGLLSRAAMGIVVLADTSANPSLDYCQQDCAAATQNMLVEAKELGIGSCWLGGYPNEDRVEALCQLFNFPEYIKPLWMIAFGYPDEKPAIKQKWKDEKVHYEKY